MTDSTNETLGEEAHGWLKQFEDMSAEALKALETVVKGGLTPIENEALIYFAAKLIEHACVSDPDATDKVLNLLHNKT